MATGGLGGYNFYYLKGSEGGDWGYSFYFLCCRKVKKQL